MRKSTNMDSIAICSECFRELSVGEIIYLDKGEDKLCQKCYTPAEAQWTNSIGHAEIVKSIVHVGEPQPLTKEQKEKDIAELEELEKRMNV